MTDSVGVTRYVNPAFLQWTGMNQSSIIGQNLFDLMKITAQAGSKESVWSSAKKNLNSGKVWTGEVEFARADGQIAISELILSPLLDSDGKLSECIAIFNDLAERKNSIEK